MLPLWVFITFALLFLLIVFLLLRLRNCKCSLYETFEADGKAEAKTDGEADGKAEASDASDASETTAEVVVKKAEKEVVETDEETEDATDATAPKASAKKPEEKKKETMADKFMNYGEMKIFDNLRDNAYSLQDIKRMIREGEINEKMIEKFLARVEKMEVRGEPASSKKSTDTTVEGFSGGRMPTYANAFFS